MHFISQLRADFPCSALFCITITSLINLASLNQQLLHCPSKDGKNKPKQLPAQGEQASGAPGDVWLFKRRKHLSDST